MRETQDASNTGAVLADGVARGAAKVGLEPALVVAPPLAVVTIAAISLPGWVPIAAPLCVAGWFGLIVLWAVSVVRRIAKRQPGQPGQPGQARVRPFHTLVVLPGFLAILLLLCLSDLPIRARYVLSRDEMTSAAEAVLHARGTSPTGRIGSIPVQAVETNGVTVSFVTSGFGTTDRWGYLYAPDGLVGTDGLRLTDLADGWYVFHEGSGRFPPV